MFPRPGPLLLTGEGARNPVPRWSATCLDQPPTVGLLPITSAPVNAARTSSWALSAHSGLPWVLPQRWPSGLSHVHRRGLPRGSDSPALQHFPRPLFLWVTLSWRLRPLPPRLLTRALPRMREPSLGLPAPCLYSCPSPLVPALLGRLSPLTWTLTGCPASVSPA